MENKLTTKRIQRYVARASTCFYTIKEIETLLEIISTQVLSDWRTKGVDDSLFNDIDTDLRSFIKHGSIVDTLNENYVQSTEAVDPGDTRYYNLNLLQYFLINYKRIFLFLTLVPLSNVPLYINDILLKPFVRWRLTIAK